MSFLRRKREHPSRSFSDENIVASSMPDIKGGAHGVRCICHKHDPLGVKRLTEIAGLKYPEGWVSGVVNGPGAELVFGIAGFPFAPTVIAAPISSTKVAQPPPKRASVLPQVQSEATPNRF